jgi:hypothetical protein
MKKLFNLIVLTLAMNFLLVAGGVGWMVKSGRLDKAKALEVKKVLFEPTTQPVKMATADATTQPSPPSMRLDDLLAKASGRSAAEQVEIIHQTFDEEVAQLDRRQRELIDLQRQVDLAKEQMTIDRGKLLKEQQSLAANQQEQTKLASDKGFQDSLALYTTMQPAQVKKIFMTLDDSAVQRYLEAMEPKPATNIIKQFKSPDELVRIQKILEKMRLATPTADVAAAPQ